MNVLIITQRGINGLNYHRQIVPHMHLQRNYNYKIDVAYDINEVPEDKLKGYAIVSFLRNLPIGQASETLERARKYGAKIIIDIDDYWKLHNHHPLKERYLKENYEFTCLYGLVNADYITTTTEHFANKIREYNKNVVVLPNSIDPDEPQFKIEPKESERVRIGWIGGVFHLPDVAMVYDGFKEVWKDVKNDKFQLCLGGWNYNLNAPRETQQYDYIEGIFTDFYKYLPKIYTDYLMLRQPNKNEQWVNMPYRRLLGKPANDYAGMYNDLDVCIVPLQENNFNSFKSQIKIIEAGYFKKAVIVSNVMPYTIDCNNKNSILITPNKRNEGWGVAMKSLILNKNKREDLAEKLNELVLSKYMINHVNKTRHELYQSI